MAASGQQGGPPLSNYLGRLEEKLAQQGTAVHSRARQGTKELDGLGLASVLHEFDNK